MQQTRSGVTTSYLGGLWEEDSAGTVRKYYTLTGQTIAVREITSSTNTLSYVQGDHLGSVSLSLNSAGGVASEQECDPWGAVRSGSMAATRRNFTGQYLDQTGLLFYNARYYDPAIGRFVSADAIVPGNASGGMDGVAVKPLTVDFHEGGFLSKLNGESTLAFWFQLDDDGRKQAGSPMGPANAQALNRYAYVQNNPLKYIDPSGHATTICHNDDCSLYTIIFTVEETNVLSALLAVGAGVYAIVAALAAMPGITIPIAAAFVLASAILATGSAFLWWITSTGGHLEMACWVAACLPYASWGDDFGANGHNSSSVFEIQKTSSNISAQLERGEMMRSVVKDSLSPNKRRSEGISDVLMRIYVSMRD